MRPHSLHDQLKQRLEAGEWLPELANLRHMEAKRFVTLSRVPSMTALLHEWYCAGWLRVGNRI